MREWVVKWARYWWKHPELILVFDPCNGTVGVYYNHKKDRVCFRLFLVGFDLQF